MLPIEKQNEIRDLRSKGYGYKTIAVFIGETRDTVRNYCREIGLGGKLSTRQQVSQSEEEVKKKIKQQNPTFEYISGYINSTSKIRLKCRICGSEIERSYQDAKYYKINCTECTEMSKKFQRIVSRSLRILRNAEKRKQKPEVLIKCEICGKIFARGNRKKYCSEECSKKAMNRKHDKRISADKIVDKDISLQSLYNRESGICYLCGMKCNWEDYIISNGATICGDWYPSIDHVIPISKGGEHSWKNIRLAHRKCNYIKSDNTPPG